MALAKGTGKAALSTVKAGDTVVDVLQTADKVADIAHTVKVADHVTDTTSTANAVGKLEDITSKADSIGDISDTAKELGKVSDNLDPIDHVAPIEINSPGKVGTLDITEGVTQANNKVFTTGKKNWTATRSKGTHQTYEVYQRNDIDWSKIRTSGDKRFISRS